MDRTKPHTGLAAASTRPLGRILLALAILGLCLIGPDQWALPLALVFIALLGIPHGATDFALYCQMQAQPLSAAGKMWFFIRYLGLIALYGLWWWLSPWTALLFFIGLSVFHFGQSNWHDLFLPKGRSLALYLSWGLFVLVVPLSIHAAQTAAIISEIVGQEVPPPGQPWQFGIPIALTLLCAGLLVAYYRAGHLSGQRLQMALLDMVLLVMVFALTPLLLAFAIYFCFWHAWDAMREQIGFFRQKIPDFTLRDYLSRAWPFTLLAWMGIGMLVGYMRIQQEAIGLGWMFVGVALITLPHMVLVDLAFHRRNDRTGNNSAGFTLHKQWPQNPRNCGKFL